MKYSTIPLTLIASLLVAAQALPPASSVPSTLNWAFIEGQVLTIVGPDRSVIRVPLVQFGDGNCDGVVDRTDYQNMSACIAAGSDAAWQCWHFYDADGDHAWTQTDLEVFKDQVERMVRLQPVHRWVVWQPVVATWPGVSDGG